MSDEYGPCCCHLNHDDIPADPELGLEAIPGKPRTESCCAVQFRALRQQVASLTEERDRLGRIAVGCGDQADRWAAKYREAAEERNRLKAALLDMTEDLEARWDMTDPRTNPGIRANVERARAILSEPQG